MFPNFSLPQVWAFLAGCLTIAMLSPLIQQLANRITDDEPRKKKIYGLHHAVLNFDLSLNTM